MPAGDRDPLQLLTIPQTARILSRSRQQVYKDIRLGRIRVVRLGARRMVPRAELERYIGWDGDLNNLKPLGNVDVLRDDH